MFGLRAGVLEDLACSGGDDGVGGYDEGGVFFGGFISVFCGRGFFLLGEDGLVDVETLASGGGADVLFGRVLGLVEVFGEGGGGDFDVVEAELTEG